MLSRKFILLGTLITAVFILSNYSSNAEAKTNEESKSMSMIIVAVEIEIKKDAINDQVYEVLRVMEKETQKESGCIRFIFTVDVNNPTKLRIYEEWENIEALRAHFKMPHMPRFMKTLNEIKQSMNVKVYEINKEVNLPS